MAVVILGYPLFGGAAWRPVSIAFRAYRMTLLRRWLRTEKVDGPVHNKLRKACPFAQRAPIRATVQEAPILISAYLPALPSPARLPLFGNQFLERLDPGICSAGTSRSSILTVLCQGDFSTLEVGRIVDVVARAVTRLPGLSGHP